MFGKIVFISIVLASLIIKVRTSSNSSVELDVNVHCKKAIQEAGPTCRMLNEKDVSNSTQLNPLPPVGVGGPRTQTSECCALVQVIDCMKNLVKVNLIINLKEHANIGV